MAALELRTKPLDPTQRQASTLRQATGAPVISISVPSRRSSGSDADMMYAWSIGTTRAAQTHAAPREQVDCPPEVYIG
ncbi:MAG TPA: hypothetical protein VH253_14465 [Phycisphaerae bacterium]|nr:hypothetical protein [Phycisphaerae bacterium]